MDAAIAWGFTESAQERERAGLRGGEALGRIHARACVEAGAAATAVLAIWSRLASSEQARSPLGNGEVPERGWEAIIRVPCVLN